MKRNQLRTAVLPFALVMASPTTAEPVATAALPAADTATIDRLARQAFEQIRAGKSFAALTSLFGNNQLIQAKTAELTMLANQIDSLRNIYGPMAECRLVEERSSGGLVANRLYLCRHELHVTRWKLLFANTTKGWSGINITYDDKIALGLDE